LNGFTDVPAGRLYYEVEGEGPPLTLVHAGVAHLRMWDLQAADWAERYRVIRYDTRGFGRTQCEDVPYSNRADLAALLDHLGVSRTHLLGASRGGTIAIDFTLEHPARVASLIAVAGRGRGGVGRLRTASRRAPRMHRGPRAARTQYRARAPRSSARSTWPTSG